MTGSNLLNTLFKISALLLGGVLIGACTKMEPKSEVETFEVIPAGESAQIARITELTTKLQDQRTDLPEQLGKLLRGVHPKSHGCVNASFVINPDIAQEYQVGLFSNPGKRYKAQIRFSNASVKLAHDLEDGKNGSRGMAIKIYDVAGEFLGPDKGRQNQDFLMINTPEFAFADTRGYGFLTETLHASAHGNDASKLLGIVVILAQVNQTPPPFPEPEQEDLEKLKSVLASQNSQLPEGFTLEDLKDLTATMNIVVTKIQRLTVRNPLQVQYFGAAPFLFGTDKVMKFSAAPEELKEQPDFATPPGENYLREALSETMQTNQEILFNFKIQVRDKEDDFGEDQELIENASTTWDTPARKEVDAYVNVARITIPAPQMVTTESARTECENLAFTPWHSLKAHQPVGGINRLRRSVYLNSAHHRSGDSNQ
jgi:hypothetical protein